MARNLKIFFHDNCFDGVTTAALFASFYRSEISAGAAVYYQPVQHCTGDPFAGLPLDGDDNACVDFRFCPDPRMNWWFDHHTSAFQPPELREIYDRQVSRTKFYDPRASSCAEFTRTSLLDRYDWEPDDPHGFWREVLSWADVIDGARFETPDEAVDLLPPAKRVMTWLEHNRDVESMRRLVALLGKMPLAEIAGQDWVESVVKELAATHLRNVKLIGQVAEFDGHSVFFDLCDFGIAAHNKFISYLLFPSTKYSIGITRSPDMVRVSVGWNPWNPEPLIHNIAELCEQFGGGGHPYVGAVSLPPNQIERARQIADVIRDQLSLAEAQACSS